MFDRDCAIFELVEDPELPKRKTVRISFPGDFVMVDSPQQLTNELERYKVFYSTEPTVMLRYVEKIRPALRFYCALYAVGVPDWLKDDSVYNDLPNRQKQEIFGTTDLQIREFRPVKKRRGEAERATH